MTDNNGTINLTVRDFYIKRIKTKDGDREVIQVRDAFDEGLIEELRSKGVRTFVNRDEQDEDDE